jgi:Head domain of trimeric autotransporter adhesin/H-type lectin domain
MMWYADKAAFRAGYVNGTQWDKDSIGNYSIALGYNTKAKGDFSIALAGTATGFQSIAIRGSASGNGSLALGENNASGQYSTALGRGAHANGYSSVSIGFGSITTGDYSGALGLLVKSKSYGGVVVGLYNDSVNAANPDNIDPANRIFQVGNGTSESDRSNALTILQNGNTGIGTTTPASTLDVNGETRTKQLKVGDNGTFMSNIQKGSFTIGTSAGAFKTVTVNFPNAFSSVPTLVVTVRHEPGYNVNDTFSATIRSISTTSVTLNIQRVDSATGWGQNLLLDWIAIQ